MRKGSGEKGRENVVSLTCHSLPPLFSHLSERHTPKNCMPCRLKLPKTFSRKTSFYLFIIIFICLVFCKWLLCMITSDGLAHATGVHERNTRHDSRSRKGTVFVSKHGKKHAKAQIRHTLGTVKAHFRHSLGTVLARFRHKYSTLGTFLKIFVTRLAKKNKLGTNYRNNSDQTRYS